MIYNCDPDLKFLSECNNEELEILFDFLSYNRDGEKRLNGKLLESEEYKTYGKDYQKYWHKIAEEFQVFSNSPIYHGAFVTPLAGTFMSKNREIKLPSYKNILDRELKSLDVFFKEDLSIEQKENLLFLKVVEKLFNKLPNIEKQELLSNFKLEVINWEKFNLRKIFEEKIITNSFSFWKIVNTMVAYISKKGTFYIFDNTFNNGNVILAILIISGLRKIKK